MSKMLMKSNLLLLLHFAHQQEQGMVTSLSDAERNVIGTMDRWGAKDFLVNILTWKQLQTLKLAQALNGEIPPVWTDMEVVHQIDQDAFLLFQHHSFQEVQIEAERVFAAFLAQVEGMSEEELNDPRHFPWQEGEPLYAETLGNGLMHPCTQLTTFYLQHHKRSQALQLQEEMEEAARRAELPSEMLGAVIYNQVCFYAKNGWPEKAIHLLPEPLQLRPTLFEWSKHDTDLDSLRTYPAFQAIFERSDLQGQVPPAPLISPQELHSASVTASSPLIVDVRGATEFTGGHLAGAINIPLGLLMHSLADLPKERTVVTYCNMHHRGASRGERAAKQLREQGYQVYALDGGYPAWKEQGYPTEAIPQERERKEQE